MPNTDDDPDDLYDFYTISDLLKRNIITDRSELPDLIANRGFPAGLKFNDNLQARRIFAKVLVNKWLDKNLRPPPVYPPAAVPKGTKSERVEP
ncbi:hypothetical protein [Phyllobacterium chamaecytisi]|uniref:hypothetical protein n=1 Tax=Phyllobacterium chamaecytisi TaxID=2876082 RepID=UPI001CD01D28|nr:hypothetical protein [Phyllobacterium sp. KW56]MBZ9604257.1 hypothetical protein [Phyllobacterium sp. KW56]